MKLKEELLNRMIELQEEVTSKHSSKTESSLALSHLMVVSQFYTAMGYTDE